MLILCSLIPLLLLIHLNVLAAQQCDKGFFYLQKEISCKDCREYCTKLYTLSIEQKQFCSPFCTASPTTFSPSVTSLPPNPTNIAIYVIIIILVILVFVVIGLLVYFRDKLPCNRQGKPSPQPSLNSDQDGEPGYANSKTLYIPMGLRGAGNANNDTIYFPRESVEGDDPLSDLPMPESSTPPRKDSFLFGEVTTEAVERDTSCDVEYAPM